MQCYYGILLLVYKPVVRDMRTLNVEMYVCKMIVGKIIAVN